MRYWVGLTDFDWCRFLGARPELDEVNFWQPSARRMPVRLVPGDQCLFKLHAAHGGWIVGGGTFATYSALPAPMVWEKSGAATLPDMVRRIER